MKSIKILLCCSLFFLYMGKSVLAQSFEYQDRQYWIETMTKIANPVLINMSQGTLRKNMPTETLSVDPLRKQVCYLEAFGRTVNGIAPWLELGPDNSREGKLRMHYIDMVVKGIKNAVNPKSTDYLIFDGRHFQPLVDTAFLCQGLLRAPKQLWGNLDINTKNSLVTELKKSRVIKPKESNWLLFASMVEATLLEFTNECDSDRLFYGVNRFLNNWYKGDAWYGDGKELHLDYYNSLVIHPMLTDILKIIKKHNLKYSEFLEIQINRQKRLSAQLEKLISPEATYPVIGRSITYRFGVFHALAQSSLYGILPKDISVSQVRSALTAIMKRQLSDPNNFDENGWLRIGFNGSQIQMSEDYINTGSLYMCTAVFLPLGLPENNPFWTDPYSEWTNLKAWKGIDIGRDKALRNG